MFAYRRGEDSSRVWGIAQGCCNHWDCPRCGLLLAKKHYGRIVEGCREISRQHKLWFITLTCRGRDIEKAAAEAQYLKWTNRVLTAMRQRASRAGDAWYYVQVTERQKRGHPHSHILTTFCPPDLRQGTHRKWKTSNDGDRIADDQPCLRSDWLRERCVAAGLGPEYDISEVESPEAASRYVAKYLFKDSLLTRWPKHWRRVRYSQSWPNNEPETTEARCLLTAEDWYYLAEDAMIVTLPTDDMQAAVNALEGLYGHDVLVRLADYNIQFGGNRSANLRAWMKHWREAEKQGQRAISG